MTTQRAKPVSEQLDEWLPRDDRQSYRTAAYTVALSLCALACGVGLMTVYHLLTPFLHPLLWATLIGTVLFPLKQRVTSGTRSWLDGLRTTSTPLILGFLCLPLTLLDSIGEQLWTIVTSMKIVYVAVGYTAMKALTYEQTLVSIIGYAEDVYLLVDRVLGALAGKWAMPFVVVYTCIFIGWLYLQPRDKPNKKLARILSLPIWLLLLSIISCAFGILRVPVFAAAAIAIGLIAAGQMHFPKEENDDEKDGDKQSKEDGELDKTTAVGARVAKSESTDAVRERSNTIMYNMLIACCVLFIVRHTWLLTVLLAPMPYVIVKKTVLVSSSSSMGASLASAVDSLRTSSNRLVSVAVPHTLRNFVTFMFTSDQKLIDGLSNAMDVLSTVIVIIGVFLGALLAVGFVVVQVHSETLHMVKLGGSLLGKMQTGGSEWMANFTDKQLAEHDIDAYVEQGVQHAKAYLTQQVRQLSTGDADRATQLETQVVDLVDRVVKMWKERNMAEISKHSSQMQSKGHTDLWTQLTHFTNIAGLKEQLMEVVKENVSTLTAVAESVWGLISANLSVIASLLAGMLGLVLNFGMELINFLIQTTVFLTLLYHLLASSKDQWKPFEWMAALDPTSNKRNGSESGIGDAMELEEQGGLLYFTGLLYVADDGKTVTSAFEDAVKGVFVLSAQMATFYGMYIWFIHTLFGLNVVFVPAVVAFALAIVPLAPPCSICVVGIMELWLASGEAGAATLFALLALAPMMLVEDAFYRQLKGSHPYVTGMAVIGGMYWMGAQGAIVGPIIICCFLAMINLVVGLMM